MNARAEERELADMRSDTIKYLRYVADGENGKEALALIFSAAHIQHPFTVKREGVAS